MEFVGTVTKGLLCSACSKPWEPESASQCAGCEAIHCDLCLAMATAAGCSTCKKTDAGFVSISRLVRQLAANAKVCCQHKLQGCEWTGIRADYKTHRCQHSAEKEEEEEVPHVPYHYVHSGLIPPELQCPLCSTPFVDPLQLPCEHVFCSGCIKTALQTKQACPTCGHQPATGDQLTSGPKVISAMLDEVQVFCQFRAYDCDWVGPRAALNTHVLAECKKKDTTNTNATAAASSAAGSSTMQLETLTEFKSIAAADTEQQVYAMAHLQAPRLKDLEERKKPLSISAVIDVSGSMSGNKLQMAQESLKFMIDEMTDRDELGIIAFHTDVAETIVLTKMDETGKERCRRAADSLRALNRTNLSGGLFAGMDQVQHLPFSPQPGSMMTNRCGQTMGSVPRCQRLPLSQQLQATNSPVDVAPPTLAPPTMVPSTRALVDAPDTCRAVLLFTDGMANGGLTDEAQFKQALQGKLSLKDTKDMVVHTFGFGADHNARLLQSLAEIASGSYYFIQDVATMKESFADCLGGLMSTVAQNIQLTIWAGQGFEVAKVLTAFKQETDPSTGVTTVRMRDLYSTEKRDVLVRLKLSGTAEEEGGASPFAVSATAVPLVHFRVTFDSLLSGKAETVNAQCTIIPAAAKDESEEPNETIGEQRARIEATEVMTTARAMADQGDVAGAQQYMQSNRSRLKAQCSKSSYVGAMMDDMEEVEEAMSTPQAWQGQGSKAMAQVQSCHGQQRMNRGSEAKTNLGYDTEWKQAMRCKSRKN